MVNALGIHFPFSILWRGIRGVRAGVVHFKLKIRVKPAQVCPTAAACTICVYSFYLFYFRFVTVSFVVY